MCTSECVSTRAHAYFISWTNSIFFSPSIEDKISIQNYIEKGCKNKIRDLFLIFNNLEFEQKKNAFDIIYKKSLKKEISFFFNLIKEFSEKATSSFNLKKNSLFTEYKQVRINLEGRKIKKILLKIVQDDPNNNDIIKQFSRLKEIKKKVPQWSYKLIDNVNLEQEGIENEEILKAYYSPIRSRKSKRVVVFNYDHDLEDTNTSSNPQDPNNNDDETDDIYLIRYSQ